jgi:thiosulfate/3-mercaptopyruvate sulfurtransferase
MQSAQLPTAQKEGVSRNMENEVDVSASSANGDRRNLTLDHRVADGIVVTAGQLLEWQDTKLQVRVLDVRWRLGEADGYPQFCSGHIPGARYVDLEAELCGPPSTEGGRHPLPPLDALQASARRWGLNADGGVVVYDDTGNLSAARAWWLLRWGGLRSVWLLDGGLKSWIAAGGQLETGGGDPVAVGNVQLEPGHMPAIDAVDVEAFVSAGGILLDARSGERYRGEVEPIDARAGHIPGAVSAPASENLVDERYLSPAALRSRFERLGVDGSRPVCVYCGSGVTAAQEVAALERAGFKALLYAGSWSQWSADPLRPIATGG